MKTLLLIIALSVSVFAQAFSPEWAKVPTSFVGDSPKSIHGSLLSARPSLDRKDEFETMAAFEKRRADKASISLGGKRTAADQLVFVYKPDSLALMPGNLTARYDAESETWKISIDDAPLRYLSTDSSGSIISDQYYGLTVSDTELQSERENYTERRVLSNWMVAFNNRAQFIVGGKPSLTTEVKMSPEIARTAKGEFAVLVAGKLALPYKGLDLFTSKATLQRFYDLEKRSWYLIMDVSAIWIFNRKTGEIYKKFTPTE